MLKTIFSLALMAASSSIAFSQVGIGTTAPDVSAVLELKSTNKGFLPPRMTEVQKGLLPAPKAGLIIYQTDGAKGLYVFNGTSWTPAKGVSGYLDLVSNQSIDGTKTFVSDITAKERVIGIGGGGAVTNTVVSKMGLQKNTTGYGNTVVGTGSAMAANTIGNLNTVVGYNSFSSNNSGTSNTAFGETALYANDVGNQNTANGWHAMEQNHSGYVNTVFGAGSATHNFTGFNNTVHGSSSFTNSSSSANNTANGKETLYSNTGHANTANGYRSLYNSYTGISNTGMGLQSLYTNTGGSYNTGLGYLSDMYANSISNATAIGAYAQAACLNCVILGSVKDLNGAIANVIVGIGTTTPQTNLHVNPNGQGGILLGANRSSGGYTNLEMGISAESDGYGYIQSTKSSGSTYGDLNLNPGTSAKYVGINGIDAGYVGINHPTAATVEFPLDINQTVDNRGIRFKNVISGFNRNWDLFADADGTFNFAYNNAVKAWISSVDGSYNQISDARFKKNISPLNNVLDKVNALQPKTYLYTNNIKAEKLSMGFLAQEVIPLFPELVSNFKHPAKDSTDNTIYHAINYNGFSVIAIKAIQEQQKQIEQLKQEQRELLNQKDEIVLDAQLKTLETQTMAIKKLSERLDALERKRLQKITTTISK